MPATVTSLLTSLRTKLPAAIFAFLPITMFPRIVLEAKIETPLLIFGCLSPISKPFPPRVTP